MFVLVWWTIDTLRRFWAGKGLWAERWDKSFGSPTETCTILIVHCVDDKCPSIVTYVSVSI